MSRNNFVPKNPEILKKKYECKCCDYFTDSKKDYNKHLLTAKHKKSLLAIESNEFVPKNPEIKFYICKKCDRNFKSQSGLWRHSKTCNFEECQEIKEEQKSKSSTDETLISLFKIQQEQNNKIIENQQEFQQNIMENQKNQNERTNKIMEFMQKSNTITTNNNTINNNQRFNINIFLNEKCKDAINMNDFIETIQLSLENLDFSKQHGLEEGLCKVFMENMNQLSLHQRPIHCTDIKRDTLYIKTDDVWKKDTDKSTIKDAIKSLNRNHFKLVKKWLDENPDYMEDDSKQDYFARLLKTCGAVVDDDKVIRKLCNSNDLKNQIKYLDENLIE